MSDDSTPTPEMREKTADITRRWQIGELPFREALSTLTAYLAHAKASGHRANQARVHNSLGFLQGYRGNLTASINHYEHAHNLYKLIGDDRSVMAADLNTGVNYRLKGDFNRALTLFRSVQEQAETLEAYTAQAMAMSNEALVQLRLERQETAMRVLDKLMAFADPHYDPTDNNWPIIVCEGCYGLALAHIRAGDHQAAWDASMRSWQIAQERDEPMYHGYANRTMAFVIEVIDGVPSADFKTDPDTYFAASVRAFKSIKAEAELAQTMFAHALSLGRRGMRTTAARKLQQSLVIFTRLGMVDDAARAAEAQLTMI